MGKRKWGEGERSLDPDGDHQSSTDTPTTTSLAVKRVRVEEALDLTLPRHDPRSSSTWYSESKGDWMPGPVQNEAMDLTKAKTPLQHRDPGVNPGGQGAEEAEAAEEEEEAEEAPRVQSEITTPTREQKQDLEGAPESRRDNTSQPGQHLQPLPSTPETNFSPLPRTPGRCMEPETRQPVRRVLFTPTGVVGGEARVCGESRAGETGGAGAEGRAGGEVRLGVKGWVGEADWSGGVSKAATDPTIIPYSQPVENLPHQTPLYPQHDQEEADDELELFDELIAQLTDGELGIQKSPLVWSGGEGVSGASPRWVGGGDGRGSGINPGEEPKSASQSSASTHSKCGTEETKEAESGLSGSPSGEGVGRRSGGGLVAMEGEQGPRGAQTPQPLPPVPQEAIKSTPHRPGEQGHEEEEASVGGERTRSTTPADPGDESPTTTAQPTTPINQTTLMSGDPDPRVLQGTQTPEPTSVAESASPTPTPKTPSPADSRSPSPGPSHRPSQSPSANGEERGWKSEGEENAEVSGGEEGEESPHFFELRRAGKPKRWKKVVAEKRYRLHLKNTEEIGRQPPEQQLTTLTGILTSAFSRLKHKIPKKCVVFITVENPTFYGRGFSVAKQKRDEMDFERVADLLLGRLTSDENIKLEETIFTVVAVKPRAESGGVTMGGRGWGGSTLWTRKEPDLSIWRRKKTSILDPGRPSAKLPPHMEHQCLALCIATAIWRGNNPTIHKFVRYESSRQCWRDADELVSGAGLGRGPYNLEDLERLQIHLGELYEVTVLNEDGCVLASYGSNRAPKPIYLLYIKLEGEAEGVGNGGGGGGRRGEPQRRSLEVGASYGHILLITSITGLVGSPHFCRQCKRGYGDRYPGQHRCPKSSCGLCHWSNCTNTEKTPGAYQARRCRECGFYSRTPACYEEHVNNGRCQEYETCETCAITGPRGSKHVCGQIACEKCGSKHLMSDQCYVSRPKVAGGGHVGGVATGGGGGGGGGGVGEEEAAEADGAEDPDRATLPRGGRGGGGGAENVWYADFESTIGADGTHTPALLVAQQGGNDGVGVPPEKQVVCWGPECATEFFGIACRDPRFRNAQVLFHNLAKYDGPLLIPAALAMRYKPRNVLIRGTALLTFGLSPNNIRFKDSLLFIQTPLSAFPKMFSLGQEVGVKGTYPYLLGPEWLVEGRVYEEDGHRYPKLEYFGVDKMPAKKSQEVREWWGREQKRYEEDPELEFKARTELLEYCIQDCALLRLGFQAFVNTWAKDFPDVTPLQYVTLPSFVNAVYRAHFMPQHPTPAESKALAILPPQGYEAGRYPQSLAAFGWLAWQYKQLELTEVRDSRRGGEVQLGVGLHVDGFGRRPDGTHVALQFDGCWWHKCADCYPEATVENEGVRRRSEETLERLVRLGADPRSPFPPFQVVHVRQCTWDRERRANPEIRAFIANFRSAWSKEPLKPRDALYGGRTNSIKHLVDIQDLPGWLILYYDFVSLYPAVQASLRGEVWPLGHPRILIGAEAMAAGSPMLGVDALGIWRCRMLPPKDLHFPILPVRINEKLYFPTCFTCAEEESQGACSHSELQRSILATWCTPELELAIKHGYQVMSVLEKWQWEDSCTDLFRPMMRHFYKAKALASVPPESPAEMEELQRSLRETLDIRVTREDFNPSPNSRSVAKGALNCVWGYHGKKGDVTSVEFVETEERLRELEADVNSEVTAVHVEVEDAILRVHSQPLQERPNRAGSIAIASFVTSYARVKLWEELLKPFEKHILYTDTDSAILLLPPGVNPPRTGGGIGELSDEYPNDEILAYAAT